MKSYRLMVILALCLAIVALPVLSTLAHEGGPHVRIAHLATAVPAVDVYVNGKLLAKALAYKSTTDYLSLEGGSFEFVLTPAGGKMQDSLTEKPVALSFSADEGKYFTVVAIGSPKDKTFELIKLPADKGGESPSDKSDSHAAEPGTASAGNITITGAFARATALKTDAPATKPAMGNMGGMAATKPAMGGMAMGAVSAAYMLIKNTGSQADQLVSASCDVAGKTEIHETIVKDNVAQMQPVPALDIPANGSAELKPGGYHVMLMDLKQPLTPGQTINLTLTFKSSTVVKISVPVKAP